MPTTAVIGASRGIGLALLNELSKTGPVIGTIRSTPPSSPPPNTRYLTLDITSESSVSAAASQVTDGIDTLIINAAMGEDEKLLNITDKSLTQYLDVNVVGPHRVIRAFLPALRKGKEKKIVVISSGSGSCAIQVEHIHGFSGPYSVSKAAVK
jgi:NAD(P)-dependent dehydrogenase (short-subunit alcohol dehydrogenase family)